MDLPPGFNSGNPQLNRWINTLRDYLRATRITESADIRPEELPGGTGLRIKQAPTQSAVAAAATATNPTIGIWQPYLSPTQVSDHPSWWRTVNITQGTVNAFHPAGAGTAGGPYSDDADSNATHSDIIIDAAATWHFYLKCTISTALDATEGLVTAVAIYAGTAWWGGYPGQPAGDSSTGAPPAAFYIPLYDITASADQAYTSGPYPAGTLTLPPVWSKNSWWVDEVGFGQPFSNDAGDCIQQQRMTLTAV
jgi:hypothetical protein